MHVYRCYLIGEKNEVVDVKEIRSELDTKAVLLARAAATRAGCTRFELRQGRRVVRREDKGSICLGDEYGSNELIRLGDELKE